MIELKLARLLDDRYLSSEDSAFIDDVQIDLNEFLESGKTLKRVLLFPPVNNYLRLLIHKTVEEYPDLHSFSVGEGEARRTVVCWQEALICATGADMSVYRPPAMRGRGRARQRDNNTTSSGLDPGPRSCSDVQDLSARWGHDKFDMSHDSDKIVHTRLDGRYSPASNRESDSFKSSSSKVDGPSISTSNKDNQKSSERLRSRSKRPDMQVYVPRGRRSQHGTVNKSSSVDDIDSPNRSKSSSDKVSFQEQTPNDTSQLSQSHEHQNDTPVLTTPCDETGKQFRMNKKMNTAISSPVSSAPSGDTGNEFKMNKKMKVLDRRKGYEIDDIVIDEPQHKKKTAQNNSIISNASISNMTTTTSADTSKPFQDRRQIRELITDVKSESGVKLETSFHSDLETNESAEVKKSTSSGECKDTITEVENTVELESSGNLELETNVSDCNRSAQGCCDSVTLSEKVSYKMTTTCIEESGINPDSESAIGKLCVAKQHDPTNNKQTLVSTLSDNELSVTIKKVSPSSSVLKDKEVLLDDHLSSAGEDSARKGNNIEMLISETRQKSCEDKFNTECNSNMVISETIERSTNYDLDTVTETCDPHMPLNSNIHSDEDKTDQDNVVRDIDGKHNQLSTHTEFEASASPEHAVETHSSSILPCTLISSDDLQGNNLLKQYADDGSIRMAECVSDVRESRMEFEPCSIKEMEQRLIDEKGDSFGKADNIDHSKQLTDQDPQNAKQSTAMKEDQVPENFKEQRVPEVTEKRKQLIKKEVVPAVKENRVPEEVKADDEPEVTEEREQVTEEREQVIKKDRVPEVTEDQEPVIKEDQVSESEDDEDTWDSMFNEDGDCLDPSVMEELTKTVGEVKIQKTKKINYLDYQPKHKAELDYSEYGHIIEIYDFPADFVTRDLISAFQAFMKRGFDLKWVDDTHALGIFNSTIAAQDAVELNNPFIKVRPLSVASQQSRSKARGCSEFLQPYKPRPETSASAARRLVAGALGLATNVSREKRARERQQLKEAKEKRKNDRKNREDMWEYGKCAMDEES